MSTARSTGKINLPPKLPLSKKQPSGFLQPMFIFLAIGVLVAGLIITYSIGKNSLQPLSQTDHTTSLLETREEPDEYFQGGFVNLTCDASSRSKLVPGCSVYQGTKCARAIIDDFISQDEAAALMRLAETAFAMTGGGSGPVSLFDVASGASSSNTTFQNVYALINMAKKTATTLKLKAGQTTNQTERTSLLERAADVESRLHFFDASDMAVYDAVQDRFVKAVAKAFGVAAMYPTRPSFIARINSESQALTKNDEYWHPHVDTYQYATFEHTGIIYLSSRENNFLGGDFEFIDRRRDHLAGENGGMAGDKTPQRLKGSGAVAEKGREQERDSYKVWVEPKQGRLLLFTSGAENTHRVRKVRALPGGPLQRRMHDEADNTIYQERPGMRYAWVLATTCDEKAAANANKARAGTLRDKMNT